MATTQEVRFRYTADDRQFRTVSGRVQTGLGKMARQAAAFTLGGLGLQGFNAVLGTIRNQVTSTVDAFKEQEAAAITLKAALTATGKDGVAAFKTLADEASRLQSVTTAGDEALLKASATLAQLVPSLDVKGLRDAQTAIVGFADTFVGGDLNQAALLLGKTLGSTTNALSRYGISITNTAAPATEKLAELLGNQTLAAAFEVSKAKTESLTGRMQQLSNASGDLKEVLGEIVVESLNFNSAAADMKTSIEGITAQIETNKGTWVAWAQIVTGSIKGFVLGLSLIPRVVLNVTTQFTRLVSAAEAFGRADFAAVRENLKGVKRDAADIEGAFGGFVDAFQGVGDAVIDLNNQTKNLAQTAGFTLAQFRMLRGEVAEVGGAGPDETPLSDLDKVLVRLRTSLAVSRGEFELWGDTSKRVKTDVDAFRSAISSLLGLGFTSGSSVIRKLNDDMAGIQTAALANLRAQLEGLRDALIASGPAGEALTTAMQNVGAASQQVALSVEEAVKAISDWQYATNAIVDRATFILVDAAKDWKNAFKSFADFAISELGRVLTKLALFRFLRFAFAGSTGGIGGAILEAVGGGTGALATSGGGVTLDFSKAPPATNFLASQRDTEIQKWVVGVLKNANAQGIR